MAGRIGKVAKLEQQAEEEARRQTAGHEVERQRAIADAAHAAQVSEFMQREGLHSVEDCRAYCKKMMARFRYGQVGVHSFQRWCEVMRQETVDRLVLMDTKSDRTALDRMRYAGVIDEQNKLIPLDRRAAVAEERREERRQAEAELRARAIDRALELAGQG